MCWAFSLCIKWEGMTWLWCIAHTPCLDPGDLHCWLQPEMQYSQLDLSHKDEDDESSLMMRILVNMMTTRVTTIMIIMLLATVVICSNSHGCEFSFQFNIAIQSMLFALHRIVCCFKVEMNPWYLYIFKLPFGVWDGVFALGLLVSN